MIQEPVQPIASPSSPRPRGTSAEQWCHGSARHSRPGARRPRRRGHRGSSATGAECRRRGGRRQAPQRRWPARRTQGQGQKVNNGNGNGNNGAKGLRLKGGQGKGPITIRAINGSQVSLATEDGWSRTIAVTPTTVITKGGQPIAVSDLAVGDRIRFHQTRNADGTYTVNASSSRRRWRAARSPRSARAASPSRARAPTRGSSRSPLDGLPVGSRRRAEGGRQGRVKVAAQGTVSGDTFTATAIESNPRVSRARSRPRPPTRSRSSIGDGSTTIIHVTGTTEYRVRGGIRRRWPTSPSATG